jgi:periplasmic mercuric ion binding protein
MKKLLAIAAIMIGFAAKAQEQKPESVLLTVPQMKCWECKDRLEKYLKREEGIIDVRCNMSAGTVRIKYWPGRMPLVNLKTAINNAGFDVDDMKATEDSYKSLPPICKRKEDGGGPVKGKPCTLPPGE